MKTTCTVLLSFSLFISLGISTGSAGAQVLATSEVPGPRAPLLPRITSVDQLVPFAKIIVQRDYIGQRLGWSIKGGERVLFIVSNTVHPWVIEAFVRALHDLNCPVDVVVRERRLVRWKSGTEAWAKEALRQMRERLSLDLNTVPEKRYPSWGGSGTPRPRYAGLGFSKEDLKQYDVILGPAEGPRNQPGLAGGFWWVSSPEKLASRRFAVPGELLDLIDQKVWEVVRSAERVEVKGMQGTDFSFTWFPEWWQIVDGTHPDIKSVGSMSTFNALHAGRSEHPVFAGHLMLMPKFGAIEKIDTKGVSVSQFGDWDPMWPPITMRLDRGEVAKIEDGGFFGDFWRAALEMTKDIQYPGYPRPGTGWLMEFSLGTNPKVFGPMRVKELENVDLRDPMDIRWAYSRDRIGVVHAGYGMMGASWWTGIYQMPANHYHQYFYFLTYDVITRDGRRVRLLDKGHLTMLDDPEVRAFAAKFGDPDELLAEDWIPEFTPEGRILPPETRLIPYDEYVRSLPMSLDDPRLIYRIPEKWNKFYGEDRVTYYQPEEYMEFYRRNGQIPVRRVKREE